MLKKETGGGSSDDEDEEDEDIDSEYSKSAIFIQGSIIVFVLFFSFWQGIILQYFYHPFNFVLNFCYNKQTKNCDSSFCIKFQSINARLEINNKELL